MLGSNEGIKLWSTDGKVCWNILGNIDRITLGLDIGTDLRSLYVSFDGSNDGNPGRLLHGKSIGYIHGKVLVSDEGIKLISTDGKVFTLVSNMQIPLTPATEQTHLL